MIYLAIYSSPGYPPAKLTIELINAINIVTVDGGKIVLIGDLNLCWRQTGVSLESDLNAMGLKSRLPNHVITRYYSGSHIDWVFSDFVFDAITYESILSDHDGIIAKVPM